MHKELESQFWKSRSRYQFNIDCIAEKYCGSNKRYLALEALQRNFGEACISSPVVGLKDKSYEAICRHLNKEFAKEFERHIYSNTGNRNMSRSTSANNRKLRSYCCSMSGRKQFASIRKHTKKLRVGPVSCRVIDVITSPVKEGPVEIHYELRTMANSVLDFCDAQSSSNMERFTVTKNGKFLEAWFNNAERYWTNINFVRDHSLRWRSAYNARRNTHHNLGYVNMSDH